ncbi:UDP-galactopyranose mutase [Streptomyces sp. NBC_00620]|uniref:UDP-galactopyranose mutase n=1 Tax=Streptomyces sp. NBC_00620 TaxID=2903666 RepID=UPI00224FAB50|nr:UDP-galactopyranose mutase [Streptomyces sp. NBC_00620]MCX4976463.1 NAD(P)-binding protein [Streptomyces sp. NBC_00620]
MVPVIRARTHDVVIVGGGLFGLVLAEQIATRCAASVVVIEREHHLGGLCWSKRDAHTGVEYNPYGTHVVATSDPRVWGWITSRVRMVVYEHTVHAAVAGQLVPLPLGLEAIEAAYGRKLSPDQARATVEADAAPYRDGPVDSVRDLALAQVGTRLYETFVRGYVSAQWGTDPAQLSPEVFADRFGISFTPSRGYHPGARWQGLPCGSYSALIDPLADHSRIEVHLGRDYLRPPRPRYQRLMVVTTPIDAHFGHQLGPLQRRSLHVDWRLVDAEQAQRASVVTYPDGTSPHYRSHAPALLPWNHGQEKTGSVLVGFESAGPGPHQIDFVLRSPPNTELAAKYGQLATARSDVLLAGRGTTFYDDMSTTIGHALALADRLVPDLT